MQIARYYCDSGYFLVGNRTRNCLGRDRWSDTEPVCKSKYIFEQHNVAFLTFISSPSFAL